MDEIIDLQKKEEPQFLKKSERLYKIYAALIVFVVIVSVFVRPFLLGNYNELTDIMDLLVGVPVLSLFVLAPMGLYYSWKSYKEKEGNRKLRFKYALGHLFFCTLMLLVLGVLIADLWTLFN